MKQEAYTIDVKVKIKEVENENADLRTKLEKVADAASEAQKKLENDNQTLKLAHDNVKKNSKSVENHRV